MDAKKFKIFLLEKDKTLADVAREIGETRSAVSQCIHGIYPHYRIREKLKNQYGLKFSKKKKQPSN